MAQEFPQLSVSDSKLLFHLSLACSSNNTGLRPSDADTADFDYGFVFDIDPTLLVDRGKLIIGHMIGEGSHSIVHKGWWAPLVATIYKFCHRYEFHPVAIKVLLPERTMYASPECKAKFQREVNLLSRIKHKNIVKFIGASVEPSMVIITELLEGGSLKKSLKSIIYPMTLDLEQSLSYALDISQAMEYLHANGIIHRDLKPSNLILTKDKMHVKLADFGIAREETCDDMSCEAGSYRYMAPELFSKNPLPKGAKKSYDRKADVYSFAMVLWSLIKNEIPFKERKDLMAAYATANNMRPSLDEFPASLVPLVQSCWAEDPRIRPEFAEITKTLKMVLQNCCSTGTALASIAEIEEEVDSNITEVECPSAQAPSPESVEDISISKHNNRGTIKPNGCIEGEGESQSQRKAQTPRPDSAESKPKKKNRKLKCLRLLRCFGI